MATEQQTADQTNFEAFDSVTALAPGGQTPLMRMLDYDELVKCMRCGYCLAVCPTYQETFSETASPRGRINLVQAAAEGVLEFNDSFQQKLDLCVGCLACETACPAGVSYAHIHERAKSVVKERVPQLWWAEALKNLLFQHFFLHPNRLRWLVNLLWFYQRSGLCTLVRHSGVLKLFPGNLVEIEKLQPIVASPSRRQPVPVQSPPQQGNNAAGPRVGLFRGCIMEAVFSETNWSTYRVLTAAGCEVVAPQTQTCCGALHAHTGDLETARRVAKQNIEAFEEHDIDYLVVNAAGCGAMLKDYHHLLEDDPVWHERALDFVRKVRAFSELRAELHTENWSRPAPPLDRERMTQLGFKWWPQVVTYHDACHLAHGQGIREQPRQLLNKLPIETRPLGDDTCCGSGGIYNIVQYDMSMKLLDKKIAAIEKTGADTVVTGNPGCYLQLVHGVRRHQLEDRVQIVYIADLLQAFEESRSSCSET